MTWVNIVEHEVHAAPSLLEKRIGKNWKGFMNSGMDLYGKPNLSILIPCLDKMN